MASDWHGLSIAPDDNMFTVSPTWERIDNVAGCRVKQIDIKTGRQSEFERTDTGTMTVTLHDRQGIVDPSNAADLDGVPIALGLRDPVTDEWFPRWRGVIDEVHCELEKSQSVLRTTITCVDAFDYFAGFEVAPGIAGDTPPAGSEGDVFYEEKSVNDRIDQVLGNAGWPGGMAAVFTGNVDLQDTVYAPGESLLTVMQDAADAEFPTVSNLFVDKFGFLCFHGRYARFDPDGVSASATHWDFHRWAVGDGAAIVGDPTRAQMRPPFSFTRSRKMLRNAALCYPKFTADADNARIPDMIVTDSASITAHGVRSWSAPNLVIAEGTTTGNDAWEECLLYSTYIVDNYAQLLNRIDSMTVLAIHPDDPRAEATWELLTQIDINDVVDVDIGHPGGGGFSHEGYVEGLHIIIRPLVKDLDTGYPMVTLTADLSPADYWTSNPFPEFS